MENKPMKTLILDFFAYTTIHGLGRLPATRFWVQKILWVLAFLTSVATVVYTSHTLYQQLISLPISTTIDFEKTTQRYPPIRICNLNIIPFSNVKQDKQLTQLVETASNVTGVKLDEYDIDKLELPDYTYDKAINFPDYADSPMRALNTMFILRAHDFLEANFESLNLSDVIVECSFTNTVCNDEDLHVISSSDFDSLCIEFWSSEEIKIPGTAFGLELIVHVHPEEYVPFFSRSSGVEIAIGDDDPFEVPTGFDVDIGLSSVIYNRLPGRMERCSNSSITIADCFNNCTYYFAACNCQCRWKGWDCLGQYSMPCSSFDDLDCMDNNVYLSSINGMCTYCSVPCHEHTYKRTVSMSKWPSFSYVPILQNKLKKKGITVTNARDDLLSIRIYFSSLITATETEIYSYTIINFVSDIGGQLGLWIGVSILSLLEVVELVCLLIMNTCQRGKVRVTQRKATSSKLDKDGQHQPEMMHAQDLTI